MIRPLKLAHTSDVHLHDGQGMEKGRTAFTRVVDAVLDSRADLFLIAGDLFDHNRIKQGSVDFVYEQLARVACPTIVLAGNHDCFAVGRSVLRDMDFVQAGRHVYLLSETEGMRIEFPELHATVWGRGMIEHEPANKPMAGAPARLGDMWHIGMAHGLYADDPETGRSSLISPQEIADSGFDYLALGHVHMHSQMRHGNTLACYPGSPVPYSGDGSPACVTLVDLVPGQEVVARLHLLPAEGPVLQAA